MTELETIQLIFAAGNAHSYAMEAIEKAREYDFEEAERLILMAEEEQLKAHQTQTKLIQDSAKSIVEQLNRESVGVLTIHAMDHVNAGNICLDMAREVIMVYRYMNRLEQKLNGAT